MNTEGKPETTTIEVENQDEKADDKPADGSACSDPNCAACKHRDRYMQLDKRTDALMIAKDAIYAVAAIELGFFGAMITFQIGAGLGQLFALLGIGATVILGLLARYRLRADIHEMQRIQKEVNEASMQSMPMPFFMRLPAPRQPPPPSTPPAKA